MIRYYIYIAIDENIHVEPGDPVVWEGKLVPNHNGGPDAMLIRHLFDIGGPYFATFRSHLVEFGPQTSLEDEHGPLLYQALEDLLGD